MGLGTTPISFRINHYNRTVFTTARGVIRIDDFVAHARQLANAEVFQYPHIIDAREARLEISPGDLHKWIDLNKELRKIYGPARTAFVTRDPADFGIMRIYEFLIGDHDTGFGVFYEIYHAEQWIIS